MDRDEAIAAIKAGLKARSARRWSVTGGHGTGWGWITITAMPAARNEYGALTADDQRELSRLLDKPVHDQGESIPASSDYRREYVDRAHGRTPSVIGQRYWD